MKTLTESIEAMKARYPKELNIEGLEPALTSDIMEIIQEDRKRVANWAYENTGAGGDTPYPDLLCFLAEVEDYKKAEEILFN